MYNIYNTESGLCVFEPGQDLKKIEGYIAEYYGGQGVKELHTNLRYIQEHGSSHFMQSTDLEITPLETIVQDNHCGLMGSSLSFHKFLEKYLSRGLQFHDQHTEPLAHKQKPEVNLVMMEVLEANVPLEAQQAYADFQQAWNLLPDHVTHMIFENVQKYLDLISR